MAKVRVNHGKLYIDVMRIGVRKMRKVMDAAHDSAVVGAARGKYSKGLLASSIYKHGPYVVGWHAEGTIGSYLPYAASVEDGAEIHNIFPKGMPHIFRFGRVTRDRNKVRFGVGAGRGRMLKFYWRGSFIITPQVPMSPRTIGRSHPGQRGKHFLRNAMLKAALRYHFKFRWVDF